MPISRSASHVWALALSLCLAIAIAMAIGFTPTADASTTCKAPSYPGSGYFTSLKATVTSCSNGRKVTLAHYRCRVKNGARGKCSSRVLKYRCTESRKSIATEFNSRVTCRRGTARVVYTYQQNT